MSGKDEFDSWAKRFGEFYPDGSRPELEFRFSRLLILAARRWSTFIDEAIANGSPPSRMTSPGTVGRNAGSTTPDVLL